MKCAWNDMDLVPRQANLITTALDMSTIYPFEEDIPPFFRIFNAGPTNFELWNSMFPKPIPTAYK